MQKSLVVFAAGISTSSDGSILIQWPTGIPSNMDKYQLIFLDFSNDSLISHSTSFTLTGETQPSNLAPANRSGLSAGDKAAIGVLVSIATLAIVAVCYYILRRSPKRVTRDDALEKGHETTRRAELEANHKFTDFLHRFRTELKGSSSSDKVCHETKGPLTEMPREMPGEMPCEMLADCISPVEMPAPTTLAVALSVRDAAHPCEMPCPDTPTIASSVGDIAHRSRGPVAEELTRSGGRPLSRAATMMAKAASGGQCTEIQTVGSGFVVASQPRSRTLAMLSTRGGFNHRVS